MAWAWPFLLLHMLKKAYDPDGGLGREERYAGLCEASTERLAKHILDLEDLNAELLAACKNALRLATLDFPLEECKVQLQAVIAKAEASQ